MTESNYQRFVVGDSMTQADPSETITVEFTKDEVLAVIGAINYCCQTPNAALFKTHPDYMSAYETAQKALRQHLGIGEFAR